MSRSKYYVDVGSAFTTISSKILLLKEPTCLIFKNGYNPKLIAVGRQAQLQRYLIEDDKQFIIPVMEGAVMHHTGAVLLIREFFSRLAIRKSSEIIVYYSCGLSFDQRVGFENVFLEAGYKNIVLREKLLSLKPYVATYGNMVVADIGDSHTDMGIINEEGIISAYNIDIGSATVSNRIIKTIERVYNLNVAYSTAEKIKKTIGSLYDFDTSQMTITGRDIISGIAKNVTVSASDIYEDILYCYKRILKAMEGLLVVAPLRCIEGITRRGIFVMGGGSKIRGLDDFVFNTLSVPINIIEQA